MTASNRKTVDEVLDSDEVKNHPLYLHIERARDYINKNNNKAISVPLHEIAIKCKDKEFQFDKHSDMYHVIAQLFKEAKQHFKHNEACLAQIRCKQAMYLENMGEKMSALSIFESIIKTSSNRSSAHWYAMNSRTWLLKEMNQYKKALDSANELMVAYATLPQDQKPSNHSFTTAKNLYGKILAISSPMNDATAMTSSSHFTHFGQVPRRRQKVAAIDNVAEERKTAMYQ